MFYTGTSKQVSEIHEEARRIADHHQKEKNEKLSATKQTTQDASAESVTESKSTPVN